MATIFETKSCSRCGGSGHYSYCSQYGTRCFKCHGSGLELTKRGAAAKQYFESLLKFPIEQVQIGWVLYQDGSFGGKRGWFAVSEIGEDGCKIKMNDVWVPYITLRTDAGAVAALPGSTVNNVAPSREYIQQCRDKSVEYQTNLTKSGTIARKKVRNIA